MTEHPFQTFIDLIKFDQESYKLQQKQVLLESEIEELAKKKEQLDSALEDTKQMVLSLKKEVDSNELLMQELDLSEAEEKKRLDTVANQREYKSVQAELASINLKQQDVERQLIELWNKYETATKQFEVQKEEYVQRRDEIEKLIAEKQGLIKEMIAAIEARIDERQSKEKGIPQEWLEKYSTMRAHVSNPVVAVENNSCSACFYPVPQHDLIKLKAHKLVQCRSCYRLLYLKGMEEAGQNEQKEAKT